MATSKKRPSWIEGYSLTMAEIFYRRSDYPHLLQTFVWQQLDLFPQLPELRKFLAFWQDQLDGPVHSVKVMHCQRVKPAELRAVAGDLLLH